MSNTTTQRVAGRRMIPSSEVFKKMNVSPATGERERRTNPKFAALFRQITPGRVGAFEDEVDRYLADLPIAGDPTVSAAHPGPGRGHHVPRGGKAKSPKPAATAATAEATTS